MKKHFWSFIKSIEHQFWVRLVAFISIIILIGIAIVLPGPPDVTMGDIPLTEFSVKRAMKHIDNIAQRPHPIGSVENTKVRGYIVDELKRMNLSTEEQRVVGIGIARNDIISAASVNNVISILKGSNSDKAVLLMAHYDSTSTGPGASDDGAGVSAILEILRALKASGKYKNDVFALFTDGEEVGLLGARGFIDEQVLSRRIGVVLNFDARGTSGPSLLFETSIDNGVLIKEFARAARYPSASSLFNEIYKELPNDTDFSVFRQAGIPGLNFAYIDGLSRYHTAIDTPKNLDQRSLQHHGLYGLALSRRFAEMDLHNLQKQNSIYFDILGLKLVHYSTFWAIPIAILTALSYLMLVFLGFRRRQVTISGYVTGFGLTLLSALVAMGLYWLIWTMIVWIHPDYKLNPVGEIYNSRIYTVAFVLLGVAIFTGIFSLFRKKFGVFEMMLGGELEWVALLIWISVDMPGASYLFSWPLIFIIAAQYIQFIVNNQSEILMRNVALYLVGLLPGIVLVVPIILITFTGLTLKSSAPVLALVVFVCVLALPLINIMISNSAWKITLTLAVVSALFFIWGSLVGGYDSTYPKPTQRFYALNVDTSKAIWAGITDHPEEWMTKSFNSAIAKNNLNEYFAFSTQTYWSASTTPVLLEGPVVQLLSESRNERGRTLHLLIRSPRVAPVMTLYLENARVVEGIIADKSLKSELLTPNDKTHNRWGLRYFNLPIEGLKLVLTVNSKDILKFRCVDLSYGFEQIQSLNLGITPESSMPRPSLVSDTVLVSKSFTF